MQVSYSSTNNLNEKPLNENDGNQIYGYVAVLKLLQIAGYDEHLKGAARRVLMIIAGYVDPEGCSFPSITKIAHRLGISRQAVIKQISILEQRGYLVRYSRTGDRGGRLTNIYELNLERAVKYQKTPEIFCNRHVALVVTYTVTLLRYRDMQSLEVTSHETSESYTKKPIKKNTKNKPVKHTTSKQKRQNLRALAWKQEKDYEEKTGISKADKKKAEFLSKELLNYMSPNQLTNFDIDINRGLKSLAPKEAFCKKISVYEQELARLKESSNSVSS